MNSDTLLILDYCKVDGAFYLLLYNTILEELEIFYSMNPTSRDYNELYRIISNRIREETITYFENGREELRDMANYINWDDIYWQIIEWRIRNEIPPSKRLGY